MLNNISKLNYFILLFINTSWSFLKVSKQLIEDIYSSLTFSNYWLIIDNNYKLLDVSFCVKYEAVSLIVQFCSFANKLRLSKYKFCTIIEKKWWMNLNIKNRVQNWVFNFCDLIFFLNIKLVKLHQIGVVLE